MDEREIYERLLNQFYKRLATDPAARSAQKKIDAGTATLADTAKLSDRSADILGEVFSASIPDMPPEARESVCKTLLRERYDSTNELCAAVLEALDEALGLHLNAVQPDYPAERVAQLAHALADPTVLLDVIQRRANAPVATVAKSFHDDFIRTNARTRSALGIKCYLDRVAAPGCCKWCTENAGRYVYGDHPDDIFRRHDNCGCTVTFENGRERQDVWSKQTWQADPAEILAQYRGTTRLSREQAKKLQENAVEQLTTPGQGGIIGLTEVDALEQAKKRDHKIMITETAISKIQRSDISVYSVQKNSFVDEIHHFLLETAMNQNDSNEVGVLFDFQSGEKAVVLGSESSVNVFNDPNASAMVRRMPGLFLAHNHPSTQNFSYSDIGVFLMYDNIEGMSAVSNLGVVHQIVKTQRYSFSDAYESLKTIRKQYDAVDDETDAMIVKEFLKTAKRFGIEYQ